MNDQAPHPPAASSCTTRPGTLENLVDLVPEGWTLVEFDGRTYGLVRTTRAGGRSVSVLARELGGPDLVSANVYRTTKGDQLRACEMPEQKVLDFLLRWQPATDTPSEPPPARVESS
jgi:hypothetical protein